MEGLWAKSCSFMLRLVAVIFAIIVGPGAMVGGIAYAKAPINILALDVLSGPFKDIGTLYQKGVKFAVKQVNDAGGIDGRKIKLFVDDSELKPAVAQRKALRYILQDHVKIIIGGTGSNVVKALAQTAEQQRVILVLYSGEADSITGKDFNPSVFRLSLDTSMHAAATVAGMANEGYHKFFLLNQDYSFGHSMAKAYEKALKRFIPGSTVVGDVYHPLATKDFAPYIQKILASGADAVLTGDWGADMTNLIKQSAQFGVKQPFGEVFLSDPVAMRAIGKAAIGDVTSEIYMLGVNTPQNEAFIKRWHKQFANSDTPWPAFEIGKAYNTTMFLAKALKKARSDRYAAVIKAWEGMTYDGLMGKQVMRACDHQIQSAVAVAKIVAGPGKFYSFPYTGQVRLIPAREVSVPASETGNKRCIAQ